MRQDPAYIRQAREMLNQIARLKLTVRPDEMNMLTVVAKGGATALAKALKDPSMVLPALAGLGISLSASEKESTRQ